MAKLTEQDTCGTSFHGVIIATTVVKLSEILGQPQHLHNDGEDKVNVEWECETEEGEPFTIYDWKEYREISLTEEIHFHIGSKSKTISNIALKEIKKMLK